MDDIREVSYKCVADDSHPTWSGIEGEIPSVCPECGEEGELIETDEIESDEASGATGETGEEALEEVEIAKYLITGLVEYTDEYGNPAGYLDVGSEHELPVVVGDKQVELGNATKVE